jgi:hypothetical protein
LQELYSDHDDYVRKVEQSARALERAHLMLPDDVDLTVHEARESSTLR